MTEGVHSTGTTLASFETDSVYRYVGQRLRELRKLHGLTQAEVARIVSVSPQQYQKYEDGQTKCSLSTLIALTVHYKTPLTDLLPQSDLVAPLRNPGKVVESDRRDVLPPDIPTEADLLARLVGAFVKLRDTEQKTRLVQLVEAIQSSHERRN